LLIKRDTHDLTGAVVLLDLGVAQLRVHGHHLALQDGLFQGAHDHLSELVIRAPFQKLGAVGVDV
jgi:hypothetical protein